MSHFTFSYHSLSLFLSFSVEALWLSNFTCEFGSCSENIFLFLGFGEPCIKPQAIIITIIIIIIININIIITFFIWWSQ